jgi:hypothetical protein
VAPSALLGGVHDGTSYNKRRAKMISKNIQRRSFGVKSDGISDRFPDSCLSQRAPTKVSSEEGTEVWFQNEERRLQHILILGRPLFSSAVLWRLFTVVYLAQHLVTLTPRSLSSPKLRPSANRATPFTNTLVVHIGVWNNIPYDDYDLN